MVLGFIAGVITHKTSGFFDDFSYPSILNDKPLFMDVAIKSNILGLMKDGDEPNCIAYVMPRGKYWQYIVVAIK
mgnify:CR=1 FL=1